MISTKSARQPLPEKRGESGQTLILFAFLLAALVGLMALVIDIGLGYQTINKEQNAVDSASLAAAGVLANGGSVATAQAEAYDYLAAEGFTEAEDTISINIPPTTGAHAGQTGFVEVKLRAEAPSAFSSVITDSKVNAERRAVAGYTTASPLRLTFAALRDDCKSHTLLVDAGGTLTVNGEIYVNSCCGQPDGSCKGDTPPGFGDAFDIFGVGGQITAESVKVVGGWETHDGCTVSPDPLIRQPKLEDPLRDLPEPSTAGLTVRYGTAASPSKYTIGGTTAVTLQPGIYYGGIEIRNTANVTMTEGIYYIAGGGFKVKDSARLTAPHVMIFNGDTAKSDYKAFEITTTGQVALGAITTTDYAGLTLFQARNNQNDVELSPGQGLAGLSGSIYAPNNETTAVIEASGTTNLQVMSGMIKVSAADAVFNYDPVTSFGDKKITLSE